MSEQASIQTTGNVSSFKMLYAMVGIGLACALMIVLTYEGTLPRVQRLRAEALDKAIFKVIPGSATKQTFYYDPQAGFQEYQGEEGVGQLIYAGYDQAGDLAGVAIEASGMGYADVLRILYGYDPEKEAVVGFLVLESKETPGLGDKIEKDPNFLANFEALDVALDTGSDQLKNKVVAVKQGEKEKAWEVDCITGATISSRAIGDIISSSTEQWVPVIYNKRESLSKTKGSGNE
jgi:electron transport complex protein RnfG